MANMSYCRYQNTLSDLNDCYWAMTDDNPDDGVKLDQYEQRAKEQLIERCREIVEFADKDVDRELTELHGED